MWSPITISCYLKNFPFYNLKHLSVTSDITFYHQYGNAKQNPIIAFSPLTVKNCLYGFGTVLNVPSMYTCLQFSKLSTLASVANTAIPQPLSKCTKFRKPCQVLAHSPSILTSSTFRGIGATNLCLARCN